MEELKLHYKYLTGFLADYMNDTGKPHPTSYAISWCMYATLVDRIFSKDDMREFLFRLTFVLHSKKIVENWMLTDKLFDYSIDQVELELKPQDIIAHFGFELNDSYDNYYSREIFFKDIGKTIHKAMLIAYACDFEVTPPIRIDETILEISSRHYTPVITAELIAKADFFAHDFMKSIPEEIFNNENKARTEKEKELAKRVQGLKNSPVYKYIKSIKQS
jgi:hypothetical protein